jgi:nitrous oxidase accessory protein NosD
MSPGTLVLLLLATPPPVVTVDRDNVEITESCTVRVGATPIIDADGNGVIQITADDVMVDFAGAHLHGAPDGNPPDEFAGRGVRITGGRVTLRNARVSGFKVGIWASDADGLTVEDCDLSGNYRQRLRSTPKAEDASDWLWPHANDDSEWLVNYGAGVYIEESLGVTVRRVRARAGQNGIVLSRVDDSWIYDNDCSFLSGWGLALWRSSRNRITRNAFDFCIRGYSHGVYNRGQDSAGILMFEQCSENVVAENSATHCGDGFFAFAGREALGEVDPREDPRWYERRGNNRNRFIENDLSYAAAHGLELTFSFDNEIAGNRFVGNAICGIWGGYSQRTRIVTNVFAVNGDMGYGQERGGINIEHGRTNVIADNSFERNACGVFLWWDEDEAIMKTPWAQANDPLSVDNLVYLNVFRDNDIAVQLRRTRLTRLSNVVLGGRELDADDESVPLGMWQPVPPSYGAVDARGDTRPVGARVHLAGRDRIIMTEWGPYDWESPYLHLIEQSPGRRVYEVLGAGDDPVVDARTAGDVDIERQDHRLVVTPRATDTITPFELSVGVGDRVLTRTGAFVTNTWDVCVFASPIDPREDPETWRAAERDGARVRLGELDLRYGSGGPSDLPWEAFHEAHRNHDAHRARGPLASAKRLRRRHPRLPRRDTGHRRLDVAPPQGARARRRVCRADEGRAACRALRARRLRDPEPGDRAGGVTKTRASLSLGKAASCRWRLAHATQRTNPAPA